MKIVFFGDRDSKTIKFGKLLKKIFGRKIISIALWDGYKSQVYLRR